ncbi:hypothetical protein [Lysobacter enzymogenes]|uniref:hypothetical protein n=1 Tax=Lysobacter enzymogenes TaxID=69 RepID=UPI000F4B5204|nr:hypothetical protein [Lysobacter enzymogenes]
MNRFRSVALIAFMALAVVSGPAISGECGKKESRVAVAYLGNDAERDREWGFVYGKYSVRNDTTNTILFPAYKSSADPAVLHPSAATVEKQSGNGWRDAVSIIEHVNPADGVVEIPAGEERVVLALGAQRETGPYRLKLVTRAGCWVKSQPFSFAPIQGI